MLKRFIVALTVCVCSSPAGAEDVVDAYILMMAADTSFMMAIAPKCEKHLPGYQERFDHAFAVADKSFYRLNGIDDGARLAAANYHELDVDEMVQRFEQAPAERQIATCEKNIVAWCTPCFEKWCRYNAPND